MKEELKEMQRSKEVLLYSYGVCVCVCVCVLWESMKYDDRQGKVESKGNLGPS